MKVVMLRDGTYGVRRFNVFNILIGCPPFEFLDLKHPVFWWHTTSASFCDCKTPYLNDALKEYVQENVRCYGKQKRIDIGKRFTIGMPPKVGE